LQGLYCPLAPQRDNFAKVAERTAFAMGADAFFYP